METKFPVSIPTLTDRTIMIRLSLPKSFRFSPTLTLFAMGLAALMLRASAWQWERYEYKVALTKTYKSHSESPALQFPATNAPLEDFSELLHQKVKVSGTYDFQHQMIVINRRHATGPGYWLLTPLKTENSDRRIIVVRGFIPFEDREPESWEKYSFQKNEEFYAVVQETIPHRTLLSPDNPTPSKDESFIRLWRYPDIEKIQGQLPYPIVSSVFLQRLGGPPNGTFPAESISIDVPPSTHFGYTIEWIILALSTLIIAFVIQAFPRKQKMK